MNVRHGKVIQFFMFPMLFLDLSLLYCLTFMDCAIYMGMIGVRLILSIFSSNVVLNLVFGIAFGSLAIHLSLCALRVKLHIFEV